MSRKGLVLIVVLCGVVMSGWCLGADKKQLVPDGCFKEQDKQWKFYVIEMPAAAEFLKAGGGDPDRVKLTGGKAFLHSSAFDVKAGCKYRVAFRARGEGEVQVGMLWWEKYDDDSILMAKPHWTKQESATKPGKDWKNIEAEFTASEKATKAYIRFVVEKGEVEISEVRCCPAE